VEDRLVADLIQIAEVVLKKVIALGKVQ